MYYYFARQDYLEEHIKMHEQQQFFKCSNCDAKFDHKSNLKEYFEKVHDEQKPLKCDDDIACHYDKEKPFQCIYCEKSFPSKIQIKDHVLSVHEENNVEEQKQNDNKKSDPICCRVCGGYFQEAIDLSKHLKMYSKCRTKAHLSFLEKQGIFPSFEINKDKILNDDDKSLKIQRAENIKEMIPNEAAGNGEYMILGL